MSRRLETIFVGVDQMTSVLQQIERNTRSLTTAQDQQKKATDEQEQAQQKSQKTISKSQMLWTELKSGIDLARTAYGKITQVVGKAVEFVEMGAGIERANEAINNLAAGFGQSGDEIVAAMQDASDYTVDKMTAISAANKAMLLQVAQTPEDFAELSEYAVKLGRAMGQDAAKSIDDFVVAAGRQSKMIADNLGLMVGAEDANKRYAESNKIVGRELTDMEKKQAFLQEMLRQAKEKTESLSDANVDLKTTFEQVSAFSKDAKDDLAELSSEVAGLILVQANYIAGSEDGITDLRTLWGSLIDKLQDYTKIASVTFVTNMGVHIRNLINKNKAVEKVTEGVGDWADELRYAEDALADTTKETKKSSQAERVLIASLADAESGYEAVIPLTWEQRAAMRDSAREAENLARVEAQAAADRVRAQKQLLNEFTVDWSDYYKDQEEAAQDFASQKEQIESEHAAKLAEITAKGQAKRVQIDVQAEEEKLAAYRYTLDQAILKQSEMTGKEKESVVNAKNHAVEVAQQKYDEQAQLLADYYAGNLVQQGTNISTMLAAEDERYADELAALETNRAEQERIQKESLGRMIIEHWTAWAQMNEVSADEIMKTVVFMQEKYGLISEEGAQAALDMQDNFANIKKYGIETWTEIENKRAAYQAKLDAMKDQSITINVRTHYSETGMTPPRETGGPALQRAMGGPAQGLTLVGEKGAELVSLPIGSYVFDAQETKEILRNTMAAGLAGGNPYDVRVGPTVQPSAPSIMPMPGATGVPAIGEATEVHYHYSNVMTIHIAGDVWSDAKVREIATAIERLAPKSGVRVYAGGYNT